MPATNQINFFKLGYTKMTSLPIVCFVANDGKLR